MKKISVLLLAALLMVAALSACSSDTSTTETTAEETVEETAETVEETLEEQTILVAAAASLKNAYENELIPLFEELYPNVTVEGTYDSSGKLQTQIEEGLAADVFMSAAVKQMNALIDEGYINEDSNVELLINKIVLVTPVDGNAEISTFEDITKAESIVLGDPESVPAGQYGKEALTTLGLWEEVEPKLSLATNVTEVLNQVAAGSADCGIVYATDAASSEDVVVVAQAPEGSLATEVIYPVATLDASEHADAAKAFVEFLQSDDALAIFEKYGFTVK